MSIEVLRRTLEEEGLARCESIRRSAEAESLRIRSAASEARARALSSKLGEVEQALRQRLALQLAAARKQAQQRVLDVRQRLLDRVFDEACAHLADAQGQPEAHDALIARTLAALHHVPEGPARIRCSAGVAPVLERTLSGREGLTVETDRELSPGFRVEAAGGALEVDGTLETLLAIHRQTLAIDVLKQLQTMRGPKQMEPAQTGQKERIVEEKEERP